MIPRCRTMWSIILLLCLVWYRQRGQRRSFGRSSGTLLLWPASTCMLKVFLRYIQRHKEGHITQVSLNMCEYCTECGKSCIGLCLLSVFAVSSVSLPVAGEKGTVFALEELLAPVAVSVVPTKALHVSRAKFTELTTEDTVRSDIQHHWARRHVTAWGQLVLTELLTNICWLQVWRVWKGQGSYRRRSITVLVHGHII